MTLVRGLAAWALTMALVGGVTAAELRLDDLFRPDRVVDVKIQVGEDDWDTIRKQSREFMEALSGDRREGPAESPYTYVKADVEIDGKRFAGVGLRKKGFIGSQSMTRPSLKLKLNYSDESTSIEGTTSLTLNNNKQDGSQLSQYLSYGIFRAAGLPASRCSYAHVTVNGASLGIYSHVESVKRPLLAREFRSDKGVLYEGTIVDFHSGWEKSFEHKTGSDEKGRAKIVALTEVLNRTEGLRDARYEEEIGQYVDLPSFYSFWAMESLLGFWDGYAGNSNNYFFYLNPKTDRFHFLPWGTDSLFVEKGKFEMSPNAPLSVKTAGLIAYRLYQVDEARDRYEAALRRLLKDVWDSERLLADTERVMEMVKPYLHREQRKMPRAAEELQQFIRTRKERLLTEIKNGAVEWDSGMREPIIIGRGAFGGKKKWKPGERDLFTAAQAGNSAWIRKLAARGLSVNQVGEMGETPLSVAVIFGRAEAIETLIELGADPNSRGGDGSAMVHSATFFGIQSSLSALVENGADINAKNPQGQTALDIAAAPWSDEMEEIMGFFANMIKIEIDPEEVRDARPQLVRFLKSKGAKSSSELVGTEKPSLWLAAKAGDESLLKRLVGEGADLNALDEKGISALSWAAMADQAEAVRWLLEKGAKVNQANRDGATPLHGAAFLGREGVTKVLLENGADASAKNLMGQTALQGAMAPWGPQIKGIVEFIGGALQLDLDLEAIERGRPEVVDLIQAQSKR